MIPDLGRKVLYREATGLERAMVDVDGNRLLEIYAEAVKEVWDPYKIAWEYLPYLAWAMGVNMWEPLWRETTQRSWVARQWEFKSKRGTAAGIEMAVDYIGRDVSPFGYQVKGITSPPQQVFSGPSLTRDEREAWLANLPQIRVWRIYERGTAGFGKSFYGGSTGPARQRNHRFMLGGVDQDAGTRTSIPSTAIERLKRRARWIIRGEETDTTVSEFGSYWRVHLRGHTGRAVFANRAIRNDRFYIPSTAWERLLTVEPTPRLSWRSPVHNSIEPVTAEPERIVINGARGRGVFSDTPMANHYVPSDAWSRIFERYAVNMPEYAGNEPHRRRPVQFMGIGRYGFPKYNAWVRVSLRSIRSNLAAGDGILVRKARFWMPHDGKPVERAKIAARASKKITDRVMLELGPIPRFVAGRPFIAGVDSLIVGRP